MKTHVLGSVRTFGSMWECPSCKRHNEECAAHCYACFTRRRKPIEDCEFWDGCPGEHPAYRRGEDAGVKITSLLIQEVLDGKDTGAGVFGSRVLEKARRGVLKLMGKA